MLITIQLADFKIANHLKDPDAYYISDLTTNSVSTKKGIATDRFQFSLPAAALDIISESFSYLMYETNAKLFIDDHLVIDGYITKISTSADKTMSFELLSNISWHLKQFFSPSIEGSCQNQTYSKNCTLSKQDFKFSFTNVEIDCLTGFATLDIVADTITLGGSTSTVAAHNNALFLKLESWWQATVIINNKYKSSVVNVTSNKLYFAMNYLDMRVVADTLDVYLKCDRLYGTCYNRFNNVSNFWGFANTGRKVNTFDIFSASALHYCGDGLVGEPIESCTTDSSFFGINL